MNASYNIASRRLFADVINDMGQLLDMLSALVPSHLYIAVLSLSAICKGNIHLHCTHVNTLYYHYYYYYCYCYYYCYYYYCVSE
jgi:hypothetical protein